jgi:hypothetical protein
MVTSMLTSFTKGTYYDQTAKAQKTQTENP